MIDPEILAIAMHVTEAQWLAAHGRRHGAMYDPRERVRYYFIRYVAPCRVDVCQGGVLVVGERREKCVRCRDGLIPLVTFSGVMQTLAGQR